MALSDECGNQALKNDLLQFKEWLKTRLLDSVKEIHTDEKESNALSEIIEWEMRTIDAYVDTLVEDHC